MKAALKIAAYEFAPGARFHAGAVQDAKQVGAHLEMLRQKCKGELTPQDVIDDAKHGNSPLHTFFEWHDGKAAQQHRLAQARGLIRAVVAVYTSPDKPAQRVRAFVHIAEAGAPHYRATHQAMALAKTRDMVLRQAWREFQMWRARYQELDELAGLFARADEIAKGLPLEGGDEE